MKFGLSKIYTENVVEKLFPDPFLKNQNLACLWIARLGFIQFIFIVCQDEGYLNRLKLSSR